jgi:DNA-binding NarL/FixJ family response regulator
VLAPATVGIVATEIERRRLRALLERGAFELGAGADDVNTLLDRASRPLDVVVFAGGPEMLARGGPVELFRNLRPACAIVLVSGGETAVVRKALRAGVDGFVPEATVERALEGTVAAVLSGQISVPQSIRDRIAWTTFSLREKQVLQLVACGLTNAEIADRLYLSESTVKSHLSSSFRKLGVSSRAEAAAAVLDPDNGLVAVGQGAMPAGLLAGGPSAVPAGLVEHQLLGIRG